MKKIYRNFNFTRITFAKIWWRQQWLTEITKEKNFEKFSQVNLRKNHEILDQCGRSIKSYIKMFEAAGLLAPPSPGRVKKVWFNVWTTQMLIFLIFFKRWSFIWRFFFLVSILKFVSLALCIFCIKAMLD